MNEGSSIVMDRHVKERLIGAAILTAIIVLVVPELLSGPPHGSVVASPSAAGPDPAVRTVTVDLATSKTTLLADSPVAVAPASPSVPAPAAESAEATDIPVPASTAAMPPTIATLKAQPSSPAVEKSPVGPINPMPQPMQRPSAADFRAVTAVPRVPVAAPRLDAASGPIPGRWAVQLGSFSSRANADKVARQAGTYDASVYVTSSGQGALLRYRVRVGPLADRAAAEKALERLRKDGLAASLVPP